MKKLMLAVIAVTSLGTAGTARAQAGVHEHDGFYLQMDLGFGALSSKGTVGTTDAKFSGVGGQFGIGIGAAIMPNLILSGNLWGGSVSDPTFKINGQEQPTSSDDSIMLSGLGVGVTYYLMPVNVFFQATPSIGWLTSKSASDDETSKAGFALRLAVGKEWWVSDNWGIGADVHYAFGRNNTKTTPEVKYTTHWFGVAFSATYN